MCCVLCSCPLSETLNQSSVLLLLRLCSHLALSSLSLMIIISIVSDHREAVFHAVSRSANVSGLFHLACVLCSVGMTWDQLLEYIRVSSWTPINRFIMPKRDLRCPNRRVLLNDSGMTHCPNECFCTAMSSQCILPFWGKYLKNVSDY